MIFNSLDFALFLPIVFILYWFAAKGNYKLQNILLLVASLFFYAYWDWRFLFLLAVSIFLIYYPAKWMMVAGSIRKKRLWLWTGVVFSVGFLGIFKYYNFFVSSFSDLLAGFGVQVNQGSLNVILPVGISFYTFHGLSYIIDLYKGRIEEEKSFINYALFVSFFPLLVAGPIERATHLLPQINKPRTFDYNKAVDGLRQILWGLFKKIVIADNCAVYVNQVFDNYQSQSGSTLLLAAVFFAFQIYGDFSGYSDIALGTARLFGIELLRNFNFPYFSRDIAEFWRRWHISLTTWFRDYIYIPMGGSRGGKWLSVRNTFIIFIISGFWHGANWTFIAWGTYHALLFMPLLLLGKNRRNTNTVAEGRFLPTIKEFFQIGFTFFVVVIGWVFFRADTISMAADYLRNLFSSSLFILPEYQVGMKKVGFSLALLLIVEWLQRNKSHALHFDFKISPILRWATYVILTIIILEIGAESQSFIYFQV